MRIAMVSEHANPLVPPGEAGAGGQNLHVAGLSTALAKLGHQVTVYTRRDDPDEPVDARARDGYRVVHVPAGPPRLLPREDLLPYMGEFGRGLRERWAASRPDVVHAHFWMSGLAALLAARDDGVPVVQTFHALGGTGQRLGRTESGATARVRLERLIARSASMVAATSSEEVFRLIGMGVRRADTAVLPSGVDLDRFRPDGPRAPKYDRHRLVAVGRLVPRKGFADLIEALRLLPRTELVIAGGPDGHRLDGDPEARRLLSLAERTGLRDRLRLAGRVCRTDLPALLRSADAVVCPPRYGSFGVVPLEAMACGVPVVATAVSGLADTVVNGVTGVLVPPGRPDQLGRALWDLLENRAALDACGIAGRDRVLARYSWDRVARDSARVYERALPAAPAAPVASRVAR